jgi:DNA polymerase-1
MIVPSKGSKLIAADLSQAELRVLAMLSQDARMIKAFATDLDIHIATACAGFLHIPYEEYDLENYLHKEARKNAKAINFGIAYGISAYSLALRLNMPMETDDERYASMQKAQAFIDDWFDLYHDAKGWLTWIKSMVQKLGYVESVHGRRRYLPKVYSSDVPTREAALRQSTNMPIQATASDITNFALIRMQRWLNETKKRAMLVAVIHDCILIDCPEEEVDEVGPKLVECMTQDVPKITIPLKAGLDILDRWEK